MPDSNKEDNPKEKADVPPVLPSEQPKPSGSGGALSPEELDFTDSPYVSKVSEGRFVVSSEKRPTGVPDTTADSDRTPPQPQNHHSRDPNRSDTPDGPTDDGQKPIRSPEVARSVLADELDRTDARFALDIVAQFDRTAVRHRTSSDDVVGTFNNLVLWYAQHVATETPTQRTASLLIERSEFAPPLSPVQLRQAARKHGLDRSSSLGELLEAIE
ncbi:DUF7500 family protein [Natrarchaeobius chitinivorans]|uniref:Flagella cluster protein n=1 Tax=Natrarchaeobius chitinivorans TaxID=1679083 RepID=A0A3N6MHW2_NATCH|nr:flagella cluster protein [Natrarchaeobius chitinivorans]RQG93606.1 flagella cluster protein [Natrarchaeobius chitinivorans]